MKLKIFLALLTIGALTLPILALKNKETQPVSKASPPPIELMINRSIREMVEAPLAKKKTTKIAKNKTGPKLDKKQICFNNDAANFDCYANHYRELVGKEGIKAAFDDLRERYNQNNYIKTQCHQLTHIIGYAAANKFNTLGEAFQNGDSFCWSGYYHGVMEGIVNKITYAKVPDQLNNICAELAAKKKYSFDHYNCVHGLGHGIMEITIDDVLESLKLCDILKDTWDRSSCWSGVFMENIIIDEKYNESKFLKADDPLYPCDAVADQYKNTCYLMQTSHMLKATGGSFAKVFELCRQTEAPYQDTCYQSLGRDASGRSVSDVAQTKASCDLGKDFRQKSNCLIGAVKDFISYFHSDTQAKMLCSVVEGDLQEVCLTTAENYYKNF